MRKNSAVRESIGEIAMQIQFLLHRMNLVDHNQVKGAQIRKKNHCRSFGAKSASKSAQNKALFLDLTQQTTEFFDEI